MGGTSVPSKGWVIMVRPKKDPKLLRQSRVTLYMTEDEYIAFKAEAEARGMTLNLFLVYRPDLQDTRLTLLRRIYDLTTNIQLTHAAITGNPTQSKGVTTNTHLSAEVSATSEKSDEGWAEYQRNKASGGQQFQDPETNIATSLLRELREKFEEKEMSKN